MPDPVIDIDATGALIVAPSDKPVTLAFIVAGEPIALRRNERGKLVPEIEAQYYVRLVHGHPVSVETKAEAMEDLERALEDAGPVTWNRP